MVRCSLQERVFWLRCSALQQLMHCAGSRTRQHKQLLRVCFAPMFTCIQMIDVVMLCRAAQEVAMAVAGGNVTATGTESGLQQPTLQQVQSAPAGAAAVLAGGSSDPRTSRQLLPQQGSYSATTAPATPLASPTSTVAQAMAKLPWDAADVAFASVGGGGGATACAAAGDDSCGDSFLSITSQEEAADLQRVSVCWSHDCDVTNDVLVIGLKSSLFS